MQINTIRCRKLEPIVLGQITWLFITWKWERKSAAKQHQLAWCSYFTITLLILLPYCYFTTLILTYFHWTKGRVIIFLTRNERVKFLISSGANLQRVRKPFSKTTVCGAFFFFHFLQIFSFIRLLIFRNKYWIKFIVCAVLHIYKWD